MKKFSQLLENTSMEPNDQLACFGLSEYLASGKDDKFVFLPLRKLF